MAMYAMYGYVWLCSAMYGSLVISRDLGLEVGISFYKTSFCVKRQDLELEVGFSSYKSRSRLITRDLVF